MKKYYIISALILSVFLPVTAQVGINIKSPQGMLHINPKNDVPVNDDVVVNADGNMGLGTVAPQAKMHINVPTYETALRLVDGSERSGRVLISADHMGAATWGAIKGSGGETFISNRIQTFQSSTDTKVFLNGTTTKYDVRGAGPYLVYFRWWGRTTISNGMVSTYVNLLKNGNVVDTVEYYISATANVPFSLTVALLANCSYGDELEVSLRPATGAWSTTIVPEYKKVSTTFFLM